MIDGKIDFYSKVFDVVRQIPYGKVTTYGEIAQYLGMKSSARMVGWALNSLAGKKTDLPCHRVVNRFGALSGARFFSSPNLMRELLENENISFNNECVNLEKHLWKPNH